jgi:hypothetical protein
MPWRREAEVQIMQDAIMCRCPYMNSQRKMIETKNETTPTITNQERVRNLLKWKG